MNYRVLFSDNSTLSDFSTAVNEYSTKYKTFNYTTAQDYLFIGSRLPINHLYFKLSTLNIIAATMTVNYWDGSAWTPVVELTDETLGFTQSGYIQFTPERTTSWKIDSTNDSGHEVTGLSGVVIYDRYWLRISFNATLTSSTAIDWVGSLFSDDQDLGAEYPDLTRSSVMSSFVSGKTNWQEQHVKAAGVLIQDLINKNVITEEGQILDWREFTPACVQKAAEIIFNAFGNDYIDQVIAARKEYNERLSKSYYRVDLNNNALEEISERSNPQGFFSR